MNGARVTAKYEPDARTEDRLSALKATPLTFYEVDPDHGGAEAFHNAIAEAKKSAFGAAVTLYPKDEYKGMRLFLTKGGAEGFALKDGDDIVSVFKHPSSQSVRMTKSMLPLAVAEGGRRLDCFDTQLPHLYSQDGFKAVSRTPFDDTYKPDGWDYSKFSSFNGGKPDVVFMNYEKGAGDYVPGEGKTFPSYDEASDHQKATVHK